MDLNNRSEKSLKLIHIYTMPAASHSFLAQTRSNYSGEYTLLSPIYLWYNNPLFTLPQGAK